MRKDKGIRVRSGTESLKHLVVHGPLSSFPAPYPGHYLLLITADQPGEESTVLWVAQRIYI